MASGRIVAYAAGNRSHDIATTHPGYPDAYLMQGHYREDTVGLLPAILYPDSRLFYCAYDWTISTEHVNQIPALREFLKALLHLRGMRY